MKKHLLHILTTTALSLLPHIAQAQTYTPSNRTPQADNSLGTVVNPTGANNFNIDGGLQRGQNLFHSFTDFSIPTGGAANFTNPQGNQSIITRVTGNLFSDINGTLNTNGANFLLINPNGVVFGTDARLDVGKAFVTSTASGVDFVDAAGRNYNFGTNKAGDAPLISIDRSVAFTPAKLIMSETIPGSKGIENYGTLRTNNPGQYIGLIGGDVTFYDGKIIAPGGRVDLGGLNTPGTISVDDRGLVFAGNGLTRSDVSLNLVEIDVQANRELGRVNTLFNSASYPGSSINISANNMEISSSGLGTSLSKKSGIQTAPAGDINIETTGKLTINNAIIRNSIESGAEGQLGNININADSLVSNELYILSGLDRGSQGSGGNVNIKTKGNLTIKNSTIDTSTDGRGDAGQVSINTNGKLLLDESRISSEIGRTGIGNSKGIKLDAGDVELKGSYISTNTRQSALVNGKSNGGDIDIKTKGNLTIANSFIDSIVEKPMESIETIEETSPMVIISGGSGIKTVFFGPGSAVTPNDDSKASYLIGTEVKGNGGNITIDAGVSIILRDGTRLFTSTAGQGNAGNIKVKAGNISLTNGSNIFSTVEKWGVGKGGDIEIETGSVSLQGGSQLQSLIRGKSDNEPAAIVTTTTTNVQPPGKGVAGNVTVKVKNGTVDIAGTGKDKVPSGIFSNIGTGVEGKGGNIEIEAGSVSLSGGAQIQASTFGLGDAGNVKIADTNQVALVGVDTGILSTVEAGGNGKGGNIEIAAGSLSIKDGAQLQTLIRGKSATQPAGIGQAGNITANITGAVDLAGVYVNGATKEPFESGAISSVENGATGDSGSIKIAAGSFSLRDGARLEASTFGVGNAGTISVSAIDFVNIFGTTGNSSSNLLVNSESPTGKAGDIIVTSPTIKLDNDGTIEAKSLSGNGGNINIGSQLSATDLLLLRRSSQISTNAKGTAQQGGNGGNININSQLIVAIPNENSDITANAVKGSGGNVNINTEGLFGIQFRSSPTANSDITASSTFGQSGNVQINTPGIDPGKDTGELPAAPNDASNQISQACGASQQDNKFYITGRGGLPPNASEPQESEALWQDARATTKPATTATQPAQLAPPAIGWVFEKDGQVRLIAAQTAGATTRTKVVCPGK